MARWPEAGKAKTRLLPNLGSAGAAELHRSLCEHTVRQLRPLQATGEVETEIWIAGADTIRARRWLGPGFRYVSQPAGDLGERMAFAIAAAFARGASGAVLVGSDIPSLDAPLVRKAIEMLAHKEVVLGPALDGGYYLIGLTESAWPRARELFDSHMPWGSDQVLARTIEQVRELGLTLSQLEPLRDIDRAEDLAEWERVRLRAHTAPQSISAIVPTLNEERMLGRTLERLTSEPGVEVVVVDGGSSDRSLELARRAGAAVVVSAKGRAIQLNTGAAASAGDALIFVHADTLLPRNWSPLVLQALSDPAVALGAFRFAVDLPGTSMRTLERLVDFRSRWLLTPYGDQCFFMRRSSFEDLGGYPLQPIAEDYELVRRARRIGRVVTLQKAAITSGRMWRRLGLVRTTYRNLAVLGAYHLDVDRQRLAKWRAR